MKLFFSGIFLFLLLTGLSAQDNPVLQKSYPEQSFGDFADRAGQDLNLHFYFRGEDTDSLRVKDASQGTTLNAVLDATLEGTGLRYQQIGNEIFIYSGQQMVTRLPEYEARSKKNLSAVLNPADTATNGGEFIETKNLPRESFLKVGSGKPRNGYRCLVQGSIVNDQTAEPLIGATIVVEETGKGTITDVDGRFQLRLVPGVYHISVDHMAMKEMKYGLEVISDGSVTIRLENDLIQLQEVTLVNKRQSNVEGMLMGFDRISVKSMKQIPLVLGEKDVIRIVQMLPGVQNAGEGSSGFNVRGGSADQNMFYINRISIYNTSHLFGFFTAFSPDIISDFSLYKTNIPAKYGGRIASIFEINTRQGNKNSYFAQGGISPVTAHFMVEGPVIKNKVTFVASYRTTYSDWLLKRMNDADLRQSDASFYDATLGINADLNEKNQIRAFIYQSADKFSLSYRNDYHYSNSGESVVWKHTFSDAFSSDFSLSNSLYRFSTIDRNNITEAYTHEYFISHTEARADFLLTKGDRHRIEFGAGSILYRLNRGDILPYGEESARVPVILGQEQGLENSAYLSDELKITKNINLLLGLRYSYYMLLGPEEVNLYEPSMPMNEYTFTGTRAFGSGEIAKTYSGLEPRAALNLKVGPYSSVKASYNKLHQYIFLLSNTIALAPNDQWKLTDYHIRPPESDQVSLGYYHDVREPGMNISVEIYKKWINDVVEYKDGADFISGEPIETQVLQGTQESEGIELMVKKNTGDLTGWISYTLSRSTVLIDGEYDEQKVNNGVPFPSNFDRPHSFNLVSNYRVSRRLSFSANVVYSTGRPVTLPVAAYFNEGRPYLLYSSRNAYRIPDYFRVDFSVNLEGNLKFRKVAHSYWMLNIYNLTGRHNAYSVFYEVENGEINGYQLSIFAKPIVTLSWNFKFGNYNSN
ncbi:MAG: TonB-dependent receptor [Bacteroidota bacterium]